MKIVKLHYFDTYEIFQGHRRFTKLGFEAEIDTDHEELRDCFYALKRKSEELFYESKAVEEKQMGTQIIDTGQKDEIFNQEWEDIKNKLLSFEDVETAQKYLDSTNYNMTIAAKQIINSLKIKHEKK